MADPSDYDRIELPDDRTAEGLRRLTPAQKLELVDRLVEFGRELMAAGVRAQHRDWSESQVSAEVARRIRDAA